VYNTATAVDRSPPNPESRGGPAIRRLLIGILQLYRKLSLALLRLRGRIEEEEAARRILSGRSWAEFCDTLKAAGSAIAAPGAPKDALNQAEGYRYLSRLVRAGLEAFVEYADPKAPVLRRMIHETAKIGADNPDNHYLNAAISGEYEYLLKGRRGSVHFLELSTQRGDYGNGGGLPLTGRLDSTELEIGDDGSFEVLLSRATGFPWSRTRACSSCVKPFWTSGERFPASCRSSASALTGFRPR
jgi:hypothetical protein